MANPKAVVLALFGVFLLVIGALTGAVLFGAGFGTSESSSDDPSEAGEPTPTISAPSSPTPTDSGADDGSAAATPTAEAMRTPTQAPTATSRTATATPQRTPMLVRRFDESEIESELRRMLNDWRRERGLGTFSGVDSSVVGDLDRMATNHSVAMAARNETGHGSHGRNTDQRYRHHDLYLRCEYKANDGGAIVEPDEDFEVLAHTYAGRTYDDGSYNGNETQVARAVLDEFTDDYFFSERLETPEFNRIGIGIEITEENDVWVTGNACEM